MNNANKFVDKTNSVKCKQKNVENMIRIYIILIVTILLSNVMISTCTHVVRNSVKTNLQKYLNKCQINSITSKTSPIPQQGYCFFSCTKFSVWRYKTSNVWQSKLLWAIYQKYNNHECWSCTTRIKWCFLHTNQSLLLHMIAICS